jgi:hypothetical protein
MPRLVGMINGLQQYFPAFSIRGISVVRFQPIMAFAFSDKATGSRRLALQSGILSPAASCWLFARLNAVFLKLIFCTDSRLVNNAPYA